MDGKISNHFIGVNENLGGNHVTNEVVIVSAVRTAIGSFKGH